MKKMRYNNRWTDRRSARGRLKPITYLLLEITLAALLFYLVTLADIPALTILAAFALLVFLVSSSYIRYLKAVRRQSTSRYK